MIVILLLVINTDSDTRAHSSTSREVLGIVVFVLLQLVPKCNDIFALELEAFEFDQFLL